MRNLVTLFTLIAILAIAPGLSAQTVALPEVSHLDMGFNLPAQTQIVGGLAYVAATNGGLRIIDLSDPAHPREVGVFDIPDGTKTQYVQVVGKYAYLADSLSGVRVVDVSDPAALSADSLVATIPLGGSANALRAVGNRLYVACGPATYADATSFQGVVVLALSADPAVTPPRELGRFAVAKPADVPNNVEYGAYPEHMGVEEKDGVVYAALGFPGVRVLDVRNVDSSLPDSGIRELGSLKVPAGPDEPAYRTYASDVRFMGDRLLVAYMCLGLRLYDVTQDAATSAVSLKQVAYAPSATYDGYDRRFDVSGNLVFAAERWDGMRVLDFSTLVPSATEGESPAPAVRATFHAGDAFDVKLFGQYALVSDQNMNTADSAYDDSRLWVVDFASLTASPKNAFDFNLMTSGAKAQAIKRYRDRNP